MKEDWLKDIGNQMKDYEVDEPCGLWDNISRVRGRTKRKFAFVSVWHGLSVAALLAVILGLSFYFNRGTENQKVGERAGEQLKLVENRQTEKSAEKLVVFRAADLSSYSASVVTTAPVSRPSLGGVETAWKVDSAKCDGKVSGGLICQNRQRQNVSDTSRDEYVYDKMEGDDEILLPSPKRQSGVSFGLYATGGSGVSLTESALGSHGTGASLGPDNAEWNGSPMQGILLYNQNKEVKTKIRHRLPVRAGFSVAYRFGSHLSLVSGVSYAYLSSEITDGSDSHYLKGEQRLHYLGIPLTAKYDFLTRGRLRLYASAGALVEKCISGNVRQDFVIERRTAVSETSNVEQRPWQFSLNAAVGLQFDVSRQVGIYVEPGVSYYFDDGSSLQTIFKEKPVNFNLNLGFRFSFGH